jgi:hypothetical protein
MPAFNFQTQFADDVESETKGQTIRAKRKNRPRPGQMAHCFTGMRTKHCRRLGSWIIYAVIDVKIMEEGVLLNGAALNASELDAFAQADGFRNWSYLMTWFKKQHGLPFSGDLIKWR